MRYSGHFFYLSLGCAFFGVGHEMHSWVAMGAGVIYQIIGLAEWKLFIDRNAPPAMEEQDDAAK